MDDNQQIKEAEIDLREVIAAVWAKMYLVILAAVIFGGLIYVFTKFFVTPMYTSNTKVYILNRTSQNSEIVNTADLNSSTSSRHKNPPSLLNSKTPSSESK